MITDSPPVFNKLIQKLNFAEQTIPLILTATAGIGECSKLRVCCVCVVVVVVVMVVTVGNYTIFCF